MYEFQLSSGTMARIYFSHKGGKKGTAEKPGKAPKFTRCSIVGGDNNLLGEGIASPVVELFETLPEGVNSNMAQSYFGRRLKRTVPMPDGNLMAILKGDSFCRRTGRKESLRKALQYLPKEERLGAWEAIGEAPILLLDVAE